jgi:diguanylate cyclase (GGDEF)-like protein
VASVVLGLLSLGLFVLAIRRLIGEQAERVAVMLERYDERLATLTRVITDAVYHTRFAVGDAGQGLQGEADTSAMLRTLERARARTSTDAAIVIVTGAPGESVVSVGLSHEEAAEVARIGLPDYRGARALEISFTSEIVSRNGQRPVCSGLSVPLLESPSMLAVLTRSQTHRFSEEDVEVLQELAAAARAASEQSRELPGAAVGPEPQPGDDLFDRESYATVCAQEIAKARSAGVRLSLLVIDVDRVAAISGEAGQATGDSVRGEIGERLRRLTGYSPAGPLEGGRFAVLLSQADAGAADELFTQLRDSLAARPPEGLGSASASAGVAELLPDDTPTTLLERAETALRMAQGAGSGTLVSATPGSR